MPPPAVPAPLDPPIRGVQGEELAPLLEPLIEFAATLGSTVCFEAMSGARHGYYELDSRRIAIAQALPANAQVKTLMHELAHALVRAERQDDDPALDRASEELVAECVAFSAIASTGFCTAGYSIPYLACWSESVGIEVIHHTAALIDRLARRIEEAITQVELPDGEHGARLELASAEA